VNGQHFRAFLWLRWRLRVNQIRKAGTVNAVLLAVLAGLAGLFALLLFVALFLVGLLALGESAPVVILYVWDGLVVAFLFTWLIGLVADLQRSEALSLHKFLHLPVSPAGAFVVNYVTSLCSLTMLVFAPAMLGLSLGLACARGPAWLLLLPLLAAFLLMVTALTYQLQGWLAALMANPRRRNTVIVVATLLAVLLAQLPQLINVFIPRVSADQRALNDQFNRELQEVTRQAKTGALTPEQSVQRIQELQQAHHERLEQRGRQTGQEGAHTARLLNLALPPGWLPLGALGLAEGAVLPALLGTLGLALIGAASLWRSYRTTLRLYRGEFSGGKGRGAAAVPPAPAARGPARLLEARLPGLSEQASAVALSGFRALLRAPEAKIMLLSPILLLVLFGGMLFTGPATVPDAVRPLLALGAMAMILLTMLQFVGNQFGFDRHGFRVFVLCGAPRRDILLGKNLAVAPLALGLGLLVAVLLEILFPMRLGHLLAFVPQAVTMYLLFCLAANALSILAPLPIAAGSFRPASLKGVPLLLNLAFFILLPVILGPAFLPLGVELLLGQLGWGEGVPVCLLLSLAEGVAVVYLYRFVVGWEGRWLQAREREILEVVAARAE
jgi:hypothetical protein